MIGWGIWIYAVILPIYLAYTWWTAAIALRGVAAIAPYVLLVPVAGGLFALAWLGERVGLAERSRRGGHARRLGAEPRLAASPSPPDAGRLRRPPFDRPRSDACSGAKAAPVRVPGVTANDRATMPTADSRGSLAPDHHERTDPARRTSMPAYVIADVDVTDPARYAEYRQRVPRHRRGVRRPLPRPRRRPTRCWRATGNRTAWSCWSS